MNRVRIYFLCDTVITHRRKSATFFADFFFLFWAHFLKCRQMPTFFFLFWAYLPPTLTQPLIFTKFTLKTKKKLQNSKYFCPMALVPFSSVSTADSFVFNVGVLFGWQPECVWNFSIIICLLGTNFCFFEFAIFLCRQMPTFFFNLCRLFFYFCRLPPLCIRGPRCNSKVVCLTFFRHKVNTR